ncbi:MAG: alanine racemase [Candidatus Brocadiia bacterium]
MKKYRVWAEINLKRLAGNVKELRSKLGNGSSKKGPQILVVVKADAYGHGAVPIGKTVLENGALMLGVGDSTEAIELRQAGILEPILVLGAIIEEEIGWLISYDITPTIHSMDLVSLLNEEGKRQNKKVKVHLKIDTGMSRLGATPKHALEISKRIISLPYVELEGISSHFSSTAHSDNKEFSIQQIKLFNQTVQELEKIINKTVPFKHMANTGAIFSHPDSYNNLVRIGGMIYGVDPGTVAKAGGVFHPIMSLKSQITFIKIVPPGTPVGYNRTYVTNKRTKIATIPVGYNDGYPYQLSNKGYVLVKGQKANIIGTVTMDYIMIDVTNIADVKAGDEVVLIGKQGDGQISTEELARLVSISPYVITCGLGKRVRRVYLTQ